MSWIIHSIARATHTAMAVALRCVSACTGRVNALRKMDEQACKVVTTVQDMTMSLMIDWRKAYGADATIRVYESQLRAAATHVSAEDIDAQRAVAVFRCVFSAAPEHSRARFLAPDALGVLLRFGSGPACAHRSYEFGGALRAIVSDEEAWSMTRLTAAMVAEFVSRNHGDINESERIFAQGRRVARHVRPQSDEQLWYCMCHQQHSYGCRIDTERLHQVKYNDMLHKLKAIVLATAKSEAEVAERAQHWAEVGGNTVAWSHFAITHASGACDAQNCNKTADRCPLSACGRCSNASVLCVVLQCVMPAQVLAKAQALVTANNVHILRLPLVAARTSADECQIHCV
jgi:hypothetical protein